MDQNLRNRLLTGREVAQMCGVAAETIQKWARAGKLAAVRLSPRCIRFKLADVDRLLAGGDGRGEVSRG